MNIINSISHFIPIKKTSAPLITNGNFITSPPTTFGSEYSPQPNNTNFNSIFSGWTISQNLTASGYMRAFNNYDITNNGTPYSYNATVNGVTIYTCLSINQQVSNTFRIYQNVTLTGGKTYTLSAWVAPRKIYNNIIQSVNLYIDTNQVSTKNFSTGSSTQPFVQTSGSWTPITTGVYPIYVEWKNTASADSSLAVTGVQLIAV